MRLLKLKTQGMGSSASHAGRDLLFTYANCISPVITGYGNPQATRLRGRATNTYSYTVKPHYNEPCYNENLDIMRFFPCFN